jgi:hypothetical protein
MLLVGEPPGGRGERGKFLGGEGGGQSLKIQSLCSGAVDNYISVSHEIIYQHYVPYSKLCYCCANVLGGSIYRIAMRRAYCHCRPKPDTVLAEEYRNGNQNERNYREETARPRRPQIFIHLQSEQGEDCSKCVP